MPTYTNATSKKWKGFVLSDSTPSPLTLVPAEWTDKPQSVVDAMIEQTDRGIVIDGSSAGKISSQVAQLLLAGQAHALSRGSEFRIDNISDPALSSLETLGVASQLLEQQT